MGVIFPSGRDVYNLNDNNQNYNYYITHKL